MLIYSIFLCRMTNANYEECYTRTGSIAGLCLATVYWQLTTIKRRKKGVSFVLGGVHCAVPRLLNTLSVLMGQPWVGYGYSCTSRDSSEEGCAICMSLGFCRDLSKVVTLSYCNTEVADGGLKAFNRNYIQRN